MLCKHLLVDANIVTKGVSVIIIWISSHIGLNSNKAADRTVALTLDVPKKSLNI